jgi:electron transport complex protein RnfB
MLDLIFAQQFWFIISSLMMLSAGAIVLRQIKQNIPAPQLTETINALLPQTQCTDCGYNGCKPYAQALAEGDAINKCIPGGDKIIAELAQLLNQKILPLASEQKPKAVAYIREAECIGCTKCIQACPVDAILGTSKQMHTVIADECTGCDLCIEPCPVDCIEMRPVTSGNTFHIKTEKPASIIASDNPFFLPAANQSEWPSGSAIEALGTHEACIRCGFCQEECPASLQPQELYWAARQENWEQTVTHNLFDCIECGACNAVCPSNIPLVQYFVTAKSEIRQLQKDESNAKQFKMRFENRQARLIRLEQEKAEAKLLRKKPAEENIQAKKTATETSSKIDVIQAAIERAKAKKLAQQQKFQQKNIEDK